MNEERVKELLELYLQLADPLHAISAIPPRKRDHGPDFAAARSLLDDMRTKINQLEETY